MALAPTAPARTTAVLDRSWWSWAGPHGGLLASLLLRAGQDVAGADRRPRALTVSFLAPPAAGEVQLTAEVLREGGASSVVRAALHDGRGTAATATLTSARHRPTAGGYAAVPAPAVAPPDDCAPLPVPVELVPFSQHVEYRPATAATPLAGGDVAELVSWVRLRAGGPLDAAALTVLADVMPPALYATTTVPVPVPTVELTVAFTDAEPVTGWALTRIATRTAADGWCVDDSEVWDPGGRLLVQARQVRRVLGDLA